MLDFGGSELLLHTEKYIGPGHIGITDISKITSDAWIAKNNASELISFHYYDRLDSGHSKVASRILKWSNDGWPETGSVILNTPDDY